MDLWNDPRTQLHLDNSSDLRNDPRIYIYIKTYINYVQQILIAIVNLFRIYHDRGQAGQTKTVAPSGTG